MFKIVEFDAIRASGEEPSARFLAPGSRDKLALFKV